MPKSFTNSSSSALLLAAKLRPIYDDGEADVPLWNKEIAKYFRGKDFMNAPWLFAEAYKYRRYVFFRANWSMYTSADTSALLPSVSTSASLCPSTGKTTMSSTARR